MKFTDCHTFCFVNSHGRQKEAVLKYSVEIKCNNKVQSLTCNICKLWEVIILNAGKDDFQHYIYNIN